MAIEAAAEVIPAFRAVRIAGFVAQQWRNLLRFVRRKPLAGMGLLVLVVVVVVALPGVDDLVAKQAYAQQDLRAILQSPSTEHYFGTDNLGRDTYSRIVYGARIAVVVGFGATAMTLVMSASIGLLSGYLRGWFDTTMQRFVEVWLAFPPLVLLVALTPFFRQSISDLKVLELKIAFVIALIYAAYDTRVVRSAVLTLVNLDYVEAARIMGASHLRIMVRHILPNVLPVLIVLGTVNVGAIILTEASISFLGLGIPDPFPSWGQMLSGPGVSNMVRQPFLSFWPGLAITVLVFGFNMLGDGLRDVLDPRLRGTQTQ